MKGVLERALREGVGSRRYLEFTNSGIDIFEVHVGNLNRVR